MVVLPQESFQYSCQPQQIYVTVRQFPPAPLHYPPSLVCSPHDVFFFKTSESEHLIEGSQVRLKQGCQPRSLLRPTHTRVHTQSICTHSQKSGSELSFLTSSLILSICLMDTDVMTLNLNSQKEPCQVKEWRIFTTSQLLTNMSENLSHSVS